MGFMSQKSRLQFSWTRIDSEQTEFENNDRCAPRNGTKSSTWYVPHVLVSLHVRTDRKDSNHKEVDPQRSEAPLSQMLVPECKMLSDHPQKLPQKQLPHW